MRQITVAVATALVVGLAAEAAAGSPNITVTNRVIKGEKVEITAKNCEHGDDWTAYVDVEIIKKSTGKVVKRRSVQADEDGTTDIEIKMTKTGRYLARVRCRHVFDAGGEGVFYEEQEGFRVIRL